MSGAVVVVGSINADETLPVGRWPQPGETALLTGPIRAGLGGKGANQAVAAALAGAHVSFVGAIGTDAAAATVRDALRGHGIDVHGIRSAPTGTGRAIIVVDPGGENLILVDPGANAARTGDDVRAASARVRAADVVLAQGEIPAVVVDALATLCREVGTRFVLNLAPPIPVAPETLATADPLIVNEIEAAQVGLDPAGPGVGPARSLVVTLGAAGVELRTPAGATRLPARVVDVVDTTGAGDAFAGSLGAGLADGLDLEAAARFAVDASAFAVTRAGASSSYGRRDEIVAVFDGLYR